MQRRSFISSAAVASSLFLGSLHRMSTKACFAEEVTPVDVLVNKKNKVRYRKGAGVSQTKTAQERQKQGCVRKFRLP